MEEKNIQKRHNTFRSIFKSCRTYLNFFRRSSGFTLVELLTVVGILGILIVGAILILNPVAQFQKANDAKRKADLSQIQKSLETYYNDNGKYPPHSSSPAYRIVKLDQNTADWGSSFLPYMNTLPKDPHPAQRNYVYFASLDRQSYYLYASLERSNDQQFCNGGNPCVSLATNGVLSSACGQTCNFAVSSPNVNP